MRLLTYVFAAALLWALAATGPAISEAQADPAPRASAATPTAQPRAAAPAYPR